MPGYDGYNPYTSYGGYTGTTGTTKPGTSGGYQHPGGSGSGSGSGGNDNTGVNDINTVTNEPIVVDEIPGQVLSNEDKIWELATQAAASNPGYELSYEGQRLKAMGIMPGSDQWIQHFGMPQVTSNINQVQKVDPMDPKYQKSFKGQELMKKNIMPGSKEWNAAFVPELKLSGQGQYLMDQYDDPTGSYQEQVDDYYEMREAEQAQQTGGEQNYGYGYGYGSSGGGGYYGGAGGYAPAHLRHKAFLDQLYKGRLAGGKEVHKMLASNQKVEGANIISGLSQDAKAFDMDQKRRGILAVLQA